MINILLIESSAVGEHSLSKQASEALIDRWPDAKVTRRDLRNALPQVDALWVNARMVEPDARTEAEAAALTLSDQLIQELQAADVVIVATAMYNFGIPAALKA